MCESNKRGISRGRSGVSVALICRHPHSSPPTALKPLKPSIDNCRVSSNISRTPIRCIIAGEDMDDNIEAVDTDVELNSGVGKVESPVDSTEIDGPNIEDEVVQELDVYFNPSIDPETLLYQFQYPLRPQWRPYDLDARCEEVRVKPTTAEVEVDMTVDVNSKNYDSHADPALHMEKEILATAWKPPQTSSCTLAVRDGNKVHLNLVNSIVQLRPSMRHLDQKDSIKKTAGRNIAQDKKPKQIKDSEDKKPEQIKKDSEDDWVPLKYHGVSSGLVTEYLEKLTLGAGPQISFSMSTHEYVRSLCPGNSLSSEIPPRRSLLALPLKNRFEKCLREGPPLHRFQTLKSLAPEDTTEDVLTVLQELAVLVQGLWVLKTSLFYEEEQEGLGPLARNYVLLLFTKDIIIKESHMPTKLMLAEEMKNVLELLARHRPIFKDWKLKENPDMDFLKNHPNIVREQKKEWDNLENTLRNIWVVDCVKRCIGNIFKNTKSCSFPQISQQIRDASVSENLRLKGFKIEDLVAANSNDEFPDEVQTILNELVVNIHGIYVPKSSPDHPEYDYLRDVVIGLLIARGPNAKLKKAVICKAARIKHKKNPTLVAYQKVMQELCVCHGKLWSLQPLA